MSYTPTPIQSSISKRDLAPVLCRLMARFADPDAPKLRDPKIAKLVHEDTGVFADYRIPKKPHMIGIGLFLTIHKGTIKQDSKLLRIFFDMRKFEKDPREYITGMVKQSLKGIDAYVEHDKRFEGDFISSLDGSEALSFFDPHQPMSRH